MDCPWPDGSDNDFWRRRQPDVDQFVSVTQIDGEQPSFADVGKIAQGCFLHNPVTGGEEQVPVTIKVFDRNDRFNVFTLSNLIRLMIGVPRAARPISRHLIRFEPVHLPAVGEKHDVVVGIRNN